MKIKEKYSTIIFCVLMSFTMSFTISLILTLINAGLDPNFLFLWMRGFLMGFIIALPTAIVVVPTMQRIVNRLTTDSSG